MTDAEIASLRAAFTQEVVVWYKLDHPNVTKVTFISTHYICMDFFCRYLILTSLWTLTSIWDVIWDCFVYSHLNFRCIFLTLKLFFLQFIGATMGTSELNIQADGNHFCIPQNACCVVVEYLPGGALKTFLIKNRRRKLAFKVVIQLALDLARGCAPLNPSIHVYFPILTIFGEMIILPLNIFTGWIIFTHRR